MVNIGFILSKGTEDVKNNPILIIPNILLGLIEFILLTIFVIFFAYSFVSGSAGSMMTSAASSVYSNPDYIFNMMTQISSETAITYLILALVYFVVIVLVSAFLQAGLIGMSKEAILTGKTNFSDLTAYGKKYFLKMIGLSILMYFILIIPMIIVGILVAAVSSTSVAATGAAFFLLMLLYLIYAILCAFLFYFAEYALVYDDFGIIDSFKRSYRIFVDNKSSVIGFVLTMFVIYFVVALVVWILGFLLAFIPFVGVLLYALINLFITACISALVAVWSGRKYIDLKILDNLTENPPEIFVEETIYKE
ncbi:hypothetical protein MmiEs2_06090 [Methanimicrococcus stummii]|uniref:DUF7847 domain-containing protein n=1 Tax=Methanimicrococcus stummii TaxID=3028294 RepID=A0AA96V8A2_9EURY|nr:hypothetical protein [Methanimicrococcus sp. Es2]WNY28424.1 hypothetical protein MmiEs2_06090 [Methanimicrococcus sp. Es2]